MAENYDSAEMLKALTALNERSTRSDSDLNPRGSRSSSGFDLGEDLIRADSKRKGTSDLLGAPPLGLTQPDFGFDLPKGYSRGGGGGSSKVGTESAESIAATRFMLAENRRLEKEEAKRNKPTSGSVLEAQAAEEQGITVEELRTKRATSTQGPDKPGLGLLLDPNKKWSEAIAGNEVWEKGLDWEAKAQQVKLWGEARFGNERASAEERLGKPIKDNDPYLVARKKEIVKEATDSIGAKPKKDYFNNDSIDTALYNFKMIEVNRDINQAKTPEALEAAQARAKELKDTLEASSSAYTLDANKKTGRKKAELEQFNLRTTGSKDLSWRQEAGLAYDSSTDQLFKNIIGNAPSMLVSMGAFLTGSKLGAGAGRVVPGVGPVVGGVIGGATASAIANQEMVANEVTGGISDTFKNLPISELRKSDRFNEFLQIHNGDERLARFALTREAMDSVDTEARALGVAGGVVEGAGLGGIAKKTIAGVTGKTLSGPVLGRVLAKYGLSPVAAADSYVSRASASLLKDASEKGAVRTAVDAVKKPLVEFGTEFVEEGGGAVLGNVAQQRVGFDQRTFEGAVGAGVEGGIVGLGTAGALQVGGNVASKLFGPVLDQNDIVVTKDKKGGLTAARRSSTAEASNTVVNPDTGFARMRDVNSTVDPASAIDRLAINTRVSEALAVASGMPIESGTLAGVGVNALLRGQDTSLSLPTANGTVGLIALSDGSLTVADPATAAPETLAFIRQANELVAGLRPGLTAFAGKQLNYSPTPAGSIVATPPVGPPPPLVGPNPTGPMGGGTPPAGTPPAGTPPAGTPPAGTPPANSFTGSELDDMLGVGDPNSPLFTGNAPSTPQSNETIARALPAGLTDEQIPAAVDAWIATNSPQFPQAAREGLRASVAAAYRQGRAAPAATTPAATGTTPAATPPAATAPAATAPVATAPAATATPPAPATTESGVPADVTARLQAMDNEIAAVRGNSNLNLFQQTIRIAGLIQPEMLTNTPMYQAYVTDQVQSFPNLEWARNTMGVNLRAGEARGQAWADATLNQNNDPMAALNGVINDPAAGEVNRQAARVVVQLYQSSGVPMPAVTNRGDSGNAFGYYSPSEHRIDFNPRTTAATVPHEHLHALTVRGLARVEISARQGDQVAKDLLALVNYLYSKMPATRYMGENNKEMLAEMLRPEQLAYAYSNDIALSDMPADARRAYDALASGLPASQQPTLLSAIRAMFEGVLGFLGAPNQNIPLMSDTMMRVTAELANRTAAELNPAGNTVATPPAAPTVVNPTTGMSDAELNATLGISSPTAPTTLTTEAAVGDFASFEDFITALRATPGLDPAALRNAGIQDIDSVGFGILSAAFDDAERTSPAENVILNASRFARDESETIAEQVLELRDGASDADIDVANGLEADANRYALIEVALDSIYGNIPAPSDTATAPAATTPAALSEDAQRILTGSARVAVSSNYTEAEARGFFARLLATGAIELERGQGDAAIAFGMQEFRRLQGATTTPPAAPPPAATPPAATPPAAPPPANQPLRDLNSTLPRDLMRAGGNYQQHRVQFARDLDRAAWIARSGQRRASARDADMVAFVQSITGWSEREVRNHGDAVNRAIGALSRQAAAPDTTIRLDVQPINTPFGTSAPAGSTPRGITRATTAAAPTATPRDTLAPGEIRVGTQFTLLAGPRGTGDSRPFGPNGPGLRYVYTVSNIDPLGVATIGNATATRAVNVADLRRRVESGELVLSRENDPAVSESGALPDIAQAGPTPSFQPSSATEQATFREVGTPRKVMRYVKALADRMAALGNYKSAKFLAPGQLPTNVLPAGATSDQRNRAFESFITTYADAANRKLRQALDALPLDATLEQKRQVAFDLFGIRHMGRGETPRPLHERLGDNYLIGIKTAANGKGVAFVYGIRTPGGVNSIWDTFAPTSYARPNNQVAYGTTSFQAGSGEGATHYDAAYGAAVYAGMPISSSTFTPNNQRRMPLNRLRNVIKWGGHFNNFDAAMTTLMGMGRDSFSSAYTTSSARGALRTAFGTSTSAGISLPLLVQHAEQQVLNAIHPDARELGYDFTTNQVVVGPNRTPIENLNAWAGTQNPRPPAGAPFNQDITAKTIKLFAVLRELANASASGGNPETLAQGFTLPDTEVLFDRAPGSIQPQDQTAGNDILDSDGDDTSGEASPTPPPTPPTPPRRGLMRQDNEPTGGAPSDALFDQAPGPRAPGATVANILAGQPAPAASDLRGFTQALLRPGTAKQKRDRIKPFARTLGDDITTAFVDSLVPMVRWVQSLPIPETLKSKLNGAMYRAPNIRDAVLTRAENEYGGRELNEAIDNMARAYKRKNKSASTEDVVRSAGFWTTARYTLIKNQRMLDSDLDAAQAAQAAADKAVTDNAPSADIAVLQDEAIRLRHIAEDRAYAMAQSNPADNLHFGISRDGQDPLPVGLAGGLTTAQAEALMQDAESKFGVGALEAMSQHLYRLNAFRLTTDVSSGRLDVNNVRLFSPELNSAMPELMALVDVTSNPGSTQARVEAARNAAVKAIVASGSQYVPTTGDPEKGFEGDVLGNGFNTPNVAKERRLQGRATSIADDGITASIGGMQRSAAAAGWSEYTAAVEEAYNTMTPEQRKAAGIKKVDITVLQRLSDNVVIRNSPDGSAVGYSIGDGKELAALRRENIEERTTLMRTLDLPTRWFATMMTRWNLPFGPINMIRDVWERSENMRTRVYYAATGKQVDSTRAAQRMLQIARNPQLLMDISKVQWAEYRGQKQTNSKYGDYLREFEEQGGGGGKRGVALARDRKSLIQSIESAGTGSIAGKRGLKAISGAVNYWNDTFDTVAPLAAYIAFREQGMTKEAASAAALDLMNFRKVGTFMPAIRMVYAFAQPTATGAANLISTLKTPRGRTRLVAYVVAMAAFQALIASMGGEDEQTGRSAFDSLDAYSKEKSLPFPLPSGGFFKLPLGFGLPLLANQIALGFRDLAGEDVTNREAVSTMLKRVGGTVLPLNLNSQIKDDLSKQLVQTFAPTVLEGGLNVAINRDGFGGEIVKERFIDRKGQYLSEQGSPMTADTYKDAARFMRTAFGVDMAPEQVKEYIDSMTFGVFKGVQTALVDNPWKEATGRPTKVPFVGSLFTNTDNAIIGDSARFEREAGAVNKELKVNPDRELNARETSVLDIYERWEEVQKKFQKESRALTKSGEDKGATPARLDLSTRQRAEQSVLVREFNALNR